MLDGKNSWEHYAAWYLGTKAESHFHIDTRSPNGNGSLNISSCKRLPDLFNLYAEDILLGATN